jgi:hypothetical protein
VALTLLATLSVIGCDGPTRISQDAGLTEVTVTAWGGGSGRIVGSPDISCTYDGVRSFGSCIAHVTPGTLVTLDAVPDDSTTLGPAFALWAGDCTSRDGTRCVVQVGALPLTASAGFPAVAHIEGRVFIPPGTQADLARLEVSLRVGGKVLGSTPVNALGDFDGAILGSLWESSEVDVVVDARPSATRELFPSYIRLRPWRLADPLNLVAVPLEWTIPSGSHAGERVALDLNQALGTDPAFFRYTGRQTLGQLWEFQIQSVTLDQLPLKLGFNYGLSTEAILNIDVERYWRRIEELEVAVGLDLFEPAKNPEEASVQVILRSGFCGPATACTGLPSGDPYLSGQAQVFHTTAEQFRDGRRIVAHELIHVLGMGHTCGWTSLMSLSDQECGAPVSSGLPTLQDLTYLLLALHVNTLQARHDMPAFGAGVFGAWNGQRVVLLGEEPWNQALSHLGGASRVGWDGFSPP